MMKGTYADDKVPTHETVEKLGKDFSTNVIKQIDETFMPVPSIDNYKLQDYGQEFIKAYDAFNKSLQAPIVDKKSKGEKEKKRQPHECPKCLDDFQQQEYVKMIKHCQKVLQHIEGGMGNTSMLAEN